jgi:flavodoxin
MKTAVIYYSLDGNCALVANAIKDALNADIFEIKTVDKKKRKGLAKLAWGGFQVIMKKKPELEPLSLDINAYDLIILGTPVWAASPTPAMFSFLCGTRITGKKVALFCCHGGGKGKTFDKFKALLPGNTFAAEIDFCNPANTAKAESIPVKPRIDEWVKTLG